MWRLLLANDTALLADKMEKKTAKFNLRILKRCLRMKLDVNATQSKVTRNKRGRSFRSAEIVMKSETLEQVVKARFRFFWVLVLLQQGTWRRVIG